MKSRPVLRFSNRRRRLYLLLMLQFSAARFLSGVRHVIACVLLEGFVLLCKDLALDEKDQSTILNRGTNEDNFLTELLPAFGKRFDRCLADGRLCAIDQFQSGDNGQPLFLGSFTRRIFDRDTGLLLPDACAHSVKVVRQVCYYAYKVDFPYSSTKVNAVLEGFLATERELVRYCDMQSGPSEDGRAGVFQTHADLAKRTIPTHPIAATAAMLVQTVFRGFSTDKLVPRHGPGVTANCALTAKWEQKLAVGSPSGKLSHLYWFNWKDAFDRVNRFPTWDHRSLFTQALPGNTATVLLVPKDSRGPRLISAEPAERQFLQQALSGEITRILESHTLTAGHVNFTDQSVNQVMAIQASKGQEWGTLDLKDASDRVSLDLVNTLFGETELRELITHVRSRFTHLPDGTLVPLRKHAPMGSALCFPVMATCIWALSVSYLLGMTGDLDYATASVYVYGDDIIVPSVHARGLSNCLELFGLMVNRDKSFVNSPFAESCGVDAFRGENVTPLRLRTLWSLYIGDQYSRAKALASLVAHARALDRNGYASASEYFYRIVENELGPLPYATDTSPFLGRFTTSERWSALHNEWVEYNNRGRKSFVGFVPRTVKSKGADGPWAHLYRTHTMLGRFGVPERSVYDTPRKFTLIKRTFKGNSFACGVYSVPEWVKDLR